MKRTFLEILHPLSWEELLIKAGEYRFTGGSMLINRTLNELNYFVQRGIFDRETKEYKFHKLHLPYIQKAKDEPERLRRYLVLMLMCYYREELEEEYNVNNKQRSKK